MPYHITPLGCTALRTPKTAYPRFNGCESGFRYYSPQTGRWTARDPIGELDSINLLQFAEGSPVGYVDPVGLACPAGGVDGFNITWDFSLATRDDGHVLEPRVDKDGKVRTGYTEKADLQINATCEPCCLQPKPRIMSEQSRFCYLTLNLHTVIFQNDVDGRGYDSDTIKETEQFEGKWQAYWKRWYDINLPKIKKALNVSCNENWSSRRTPEKQGRSCGAYQHCVTTKARSNVDLLFADMKNLDSIHSLDREKPIGHLPGGRSWPRLLPKPTDPNSYMPSRFVPYPETEYDWNGLSFTECDKYK